MLRHPELAPLYREERRLDDVIARCMRRDSHCIDVGAHIGATLSTLVRLAPQGRHLAFEPLPEKARWLARKFPEVDVRALALSDRPGAVDFAEDLRQPGFSGVTVAGDRGQRTRLHRVDADTLDRVVPAGYAPDFVKLDVEGFELAVLRGGRATLERGPTFSSSAGPLPPRPRSSSTTLSRTSATRSTSRAPSSPAARRSRARRSRARRSTRSRRSTSSVCRALRATDRRARRASRL